MIKNQDFIFLKEKRALKEFDKIYDKWIEMNELYYNCLLYTSPSPRDQRGSRMPSSA